MHYFTAIIGLLPFEWAQYSFMQNAFLAVLLISPFFAFLGCMVVNNQMSFFSDTIGHASLSGIAIGMLLGIANPLSAMIVFALLLAAGITLLRRYSAASADTITGIAMSFTVALGIVLLSRNGGFTKYSRYLVGDILSISSSEIVLLITVVAVFLLLWILFFNKILLVSISPSLAGSRGVNIWLIQGLFAVITAVVVTVSIQWIGILVINAMLILPATASRNVACSIRSYLWGAACIGVVSGICGLTLSYYMSTATGATIVLCAMLLYILSMIARCHRNNKCKAL